MVLGSVGSNVTTPVIADLNLRRTASDPLDIHEASTVTLNLACIRCSQKAYTSPSRSVVLVTRYNMGADRANPPPSVSRVTMSAAFAMLDSV